jgi:4-diphosphocytidyl-2-C-methyl-D-erythritol kinase
MGAGLAGGSSNAAATLIRINQLLGLNIPQKRLLEIGKSLGADVPFCLTGTTALTEGIGEKITVLPPHPACYIVIACPNIHVSTADIFSKFSASEKHHANVSGVINAIVSQKVPQIAKNLYNVFTPITAEAFPRIASLISKMKKYGAVGASMSGTGSAVFGYFESEIAAVSALNRLKNHVNSVFLCKPR